MKRLYQEKYRLKDFHRIIEVFTKSRAEEDTRKMPLSRETAQKGACMKTGLTKNQKTTEIFFDEKDPLIHIRTHNTDLKNRLTGYATKYPDECRKIYSDPEIGCMEFEICKGRFSFRLTAPYSEERRKAASERAKKNSVKRK